MTTATFAVLTLAAALFVVRLCTGPSLADRVIALNGLLLVGMGAIATAAEHTGTGAFLPTLVALALVGPISNGMIARFIEDREQLTGEVLALGGSLLVLLSAVGVVRFGDPLARMHALAKASTLGLLLILAGAAVNLRNVNDLTSVILAGVLHVVTSPPASNMVSRAVYLASGGSKGPLADSTDR